MEASEQSIIPDGSNCCQDKTTKKEQDDVTRVGEEEDRTINYGACREGFPEEVMLH